MSKFLAVLCLGLIAVGCKGDKGDKGDPGSLTMPEVISYEQFGTVTSNSFNVTVSIDPDNIVGIYVYLTDGVNWSESPYFMPTEGVNVYHVYTPGSSDGIIQIVNAALAGATGYKILAFVEE